MESYYNNQEEDTESFHGEEEETNQDHEREFIDDVSKTGRFILSIGSKNSGKTYLMMAYLKYALYYNIFEAIHFVCPSYEGEMNNSYDFLKDQKHVFIYKNYNEAVSKRVDASRKKYKTLFLLDDASGSLLNNIDNTLCMLVTTSRHFKGSTIWMAVHSCKKILTPLIRQNIEHLFLYKIINMKLLNDLYDEYFSSYYEHFRDFKAEYQAKTKEKYSCLHFSLQTEGIDWNVKNWGIIQYQQYQLKPTKSLVKPKPKESKEHKPSNQGGLFGMGISVKFPKYRKR